MNTITVFAFADCRIPLMSSADTITTMQIAPKIDDACHRRTTLIRRTETATTCSAPFESTIR
jgi:hypothetical protein